MTDSKSRDKKHITPPFSAEASEAVDNLRVALEYTAWFGALGCAISNSIKTGHQQRAERLAGLAQYLADDYLSMLEHDVKSLDDRLTALEEGAST
ncbi:hypothetical protein [Pseudomonas yamanorum]|uniref:hypothetical protein n=1 Tax=Pseudomonas yamanorum TaxID=515393 RepID=UPI001C42E767|nr:hypothetical protein [Pseudomonas yamanorum]